MNEPLQAVEFNESVGEYLRRHREASGRGIDEIARVTKISRRYLEAMEASDFDQLPEEAFVKGFLRNYSIELGLDVDEVVGRYQKMKKATIRPTVKEVKTSQEPIFFVGSESSVSRLPKWAIILALSVVGLFVFVLGLWLLVRSLNFDSAPEAANIEAQIESGQTQNLSGTAAGASPGIPPSILNVMASDMTRFLVRVDEAAEQEVVIGKNESKIFEVHRQIEIQNLDRNRVKLEYNGRPMEAANSSIKLFNQNMFSK
jgi:cytoskeletal protein RodZ